MARVRRTRIGIVVAGAGIAVALTGCGADNFRDVKNVPSQDADSYTLWNNVDGNPNLVRVCADGVAFLTTTRPDFSAVTRIPEWDSYCQGRRK